MPKTYKSPATGSTYEVERLLGQGGYGQCFAVINLKDKKMYAGKVVVVGARKKKYREAHNEAHIMAKLKHENILRIYECFKKRRDFIIISQLCHKYNMWDLVRGREFLTILETRFFMRQLLLGLDYLHGKRIIHHDIKLRNLLLDDHLQLKIADFGLSIKLSHTEQKCFDTRGTMAYKAPELWQGIGHSYEVDIWAAGVCMFIMLHGEKPFDADLATSLTCSAKKSEIYRRQLAYEYNIWNIPDTLTIRCLRAMLTVVPAQRPKARKVLEMAFFESPLPLCLPESCFDEVPAYDLLMGLLKTEASEQKQQDLMLNTESHVAIEIEKD